MPTRTGDRVEMVRDGENVEKYGERGQRIVTHVSEVKASGPQEQKGQSGGPKSSGTRIAPSGGSSSAPPKPAK